MKLSHFIILGLLGVILGVPWVLRPRSPAGAGGQEPARALVIITPHVSQIALEYGAAFEAWHERKYHERVRVDWRGPLGTSEILKLLEAHYASILRSGNYDAGDLSDIRMKPGTAAYDVMFGGGSYEHGRLKQGLKLKYVSGGETRDVPVPFSVPAGFSQSQLDEWYGENKIGAQQLYDPQQYWLGTALSGFGIVYNRDVLKKLGVPEPADFGDLADPRLAGWIIFADPRQSGSAATSLDAILSNLGWEKGWRLLREMCANTRSYTNTSPKPPIDVSHGEGAAGLAIDFYGRGQGQAVLRPGQDPATGRVGYVDPKGSVYIDADPVSILRGGPNPEEARRFVEFCLTDEAQALWQFHRRPGVEGRPNPRTEDGVVMGPREYELRRMPVRREMYRKYFEYFIDRVDPFELASQARSAGWRTALGIMMGAFGIDTADEQRVAWRALIAARSEAGFPATTLAEMERLFYAWPEHVMPDGTVLEFTEANYWAISATWKDGPFRARCEIRYTEAFRENYRKVTALYRGAESERH